MADSMIVKPVNPISRRRFFMFLGAAAASPIIHSVIPEKLIFDMSQPVTIIPWREYFQSVSIPFRDITDTRILNEINQLTMKYIVPALTDEIFKPSPFWAMRDVNKFDFGRLPDD